MGDLLWWWWVLLLLSPVFQQMTVVSTKNLEVRFFNVNIVEVEQKYKKVQKC